MFYAIICTDKPDSMPLRLETRPAHREHLKTLGDTLKLAGPFTNEDGSQMNGSLLIVETDSLEEAKAIAESDPYARAGLFADVQIRPWNWLTGNPDA
ncbi:MAG: YciI family protein [Alphaproteobacteria bacterium]